jgi:hypothetical protein
VGITAVRPLPDLSGVVVSAATLVAAGEWWVIASAICAESRSVPVGPSTPDPAWFGADKVDGRSDWASCPVPGSLTWVGGEITDNTGVGGKAAFQSLLPGADLTEAVVTAVGPPDGAWEVVAKAGCTPEYAGRLVREVVSEPVVNGDLSRKVEAKCDEGDLLLGGGGGAVGTTDETPVLLTGLGLNLAANEAVVTASAPQGASPWTIEAHAICLLKE